MDCEASKEIDQENGWTSYAGDTQCKSNSTENYKATFENQSFRVLFIDWQINEYYDWANRKPQHITRSNKLYPDLDYDKTKRDNIQISRNEITFWDRYFLPNKYTTLYSYHTKEFEALPSFNH